MVGKIQILCKFLFEEIRSFNYAIAKKIIPEKFLIEIKDIQRKKRNLKRYKEFEANNPGFYSSFAPFDYYECIFVHIPKNAGMSVCYTLFGNHAGSHRKIRDYKKVFSERTFKKYYKFTFVRNPWDRLVSTYFFLKSGGMTEKDKRWAENNLKQCNDFRTFVKEWLNEENIYTQIHFIPQFEFLISEEGMLEIDFLGRFENIENDFQIIANKLGIHKSLIKTNTSKRNLDYRSYYDEETKEIVRRVYNKDVVLFDYKF